MKLDSKNYNNLRAQALGWRPWIGKDERALTRYNALSRQCAAIAKGFGLHTDETGLKIIGAKKNAA